MGSPRTGRTWLLNLLGRAADASVLDEPLVGTHLATPMSAISARPGSADDALVSEAFAGRPEYFFSDAHADTWIPALRDLVLRRFAVSMREGRGDALLVVKEPNGSLGAPMLLRAMPRSRLLFLVRDGRDVVDSFLDGLDGGWITDTLGVGVDQYGGRRGVLTSRATRWVQEIAAVQVAYDAHDPQRRLLVRYEDLLDDPVDRLCEILRWSGRPVVRDEVATVVTQLSADQVPAEHRGRGKFVRSAAAGTWKDHFDDEDRALLEDIMGPTLRRLGYD
jgi:hypothetical protein